MTPDLTPSDKLALILCMGLGLLVVTLAILSLRH